MSDNESIEWGLPIRCNVNELARQDIERQENGQETVIPFGKTVQIGEENVGSERKTYTSFIEWPYGTDANTDWIAFPADDPDADRISRHFNRGY